MLSPISSSRKFYFTKLINCDRKIDKTFSINVVGNIWKLGDKIVELNNDESTIDNKLYLIQRYYELIITNGPDPYIYSEKDLGVYGDILKETNVYRHNISVIGKIKSSRSKNYRTIIARRIGEEKREGRGLEWSRKNVKFDNTATTVAADMAFSNAKPEFIYWVDPNELCETLKLLFAFQEAGNTTGHTNEIRSLLEEMVEAGLIIQNNGRS